MVGNQKERERARVREPNKEKNSQDSQSNQKNDGGLMADLNDFIFGEESKINE